MKLKISHFVCLSLLIFTCSLFLYDGKVSAEPGCDFDCINNECCSPGYETQCNGGTYAGICVNACVGGGIEAPVGLCPF